MSEVIQRGNYSINKLFNRYYLPFSSEEKILLGAHIAFTILLLIIGISTRKPILGILFLSQLLSLLYIVNRRFFKCIHTRLTGQQNNRIIEEIIAKQRIVHRSVEKEGLYIFELPSRQGMEKIAIFSEGTTIYFGSYYSRRLYDKNSKNLEALGYLIIKKAIQQKSHS